jgi:hypothetical protein
LNHPVNKLSELPLTDEALNKLDTSGEFPLSHIIFPISSQYGLSNFGVDFAESARLDPALLELM